MMMNFTWSPQQLRSRLWRPRESGPSAKGRLRPVAGFTLLELLVALAVFAVLSVLASSGLQAMLDSRAHADREAERLAGIQIGLAVLGRDLEQALDRPVRQGYGERLPSLLLQSSLEPVLEFTRGGWRNPAGRARSSLQRVSYRLAEQKLWRETWPVLDRLEGTEPFRQVLLEQVAGLQVRLLNSSGQWLEEWPPQEPPGENLPRAVEIVFEFPDWGRIRRLYALPGNDP